MAIDNLQRTDLPLTVTEAATALRAGETTSVAITSAMIARADALDPMTGTYVTRFDDYAMAQAEQADEDFANGIDKGPYQGIPIGVKDILAMTEGPTTGNSLILDRAWGAGKDGPAVARLKAAGAVITGKLTTSEFAIGSPDSSKPFAIPRNPWNLDRSPGGSSAGTGNGIASGLILAGIGTDTGGSIRIPAAWNGEPFPRGVRSGTPQVFRRCRCHPGRLGGRHRGGDPSLVRRGHDGALGDDGRRSAGLPSQRSHHEVGGL
jgi:aspartyl-tRNA(Asn)/glutamyl-tRNA(Gln) amidotransferase subunit A